MPGRCDRMVISSDLIVLLPIGPSREQLSNLLVRPSHYHTPVLRALTLACVPLPSRLNRLHGHAIKLLRRLKSRSFSMRDPEVEKC